MSVPCLDALYRPPMIARSAESAGSTGSPLFSSAGPVMCYNIISSCYVGNGSDEEAEGHLSNVRPMVG